MKLLLTILSLLSLTANAAIIDGVEIKPIAVKFAVPTVYVSTTGNDVSGNGTIGNPYKSLVKAGSVAATGTIYLSDGVYDEPSGQALIAPTVSAITGESKEGVIIRPTYDKSTLSHWRNAYLMIAGHTSNAITVSNITFEGQNDALRAISVQGRSNFTMHDVVDAFTKSNAALVFNPIFRFGGYAGSAIVVYSVTNGCGTSTANLPITINP